MSLQHCSGQYFRLSILQGEYPDGRFDAPLQRAVLDAPPAEGLQGDSYLNSVYTMFPFNGLIRNVAPGASALLPVIVGLQNPASLLPLHYINGFYHQTQYRGYVNSNVSQVQATGTKVLGPMVGADSSVLVVEAAVMHVHNMPDVAIESPAGGTLDPVEKSDADATSFGYRVATRLDYNNAIGLGQSVPVRTVPA